MGHMTPQGQNSSMEEHLNLLCPPHMTAVSSQAKPQSTFHLTIFLSLATSHLNFSQSLILDYIAEYIKGGLYK